MEHIEKKNEKKSRWTEGIVFGVSLAFVIWLIYFSITLYREGWNIGLTGCLCIGALGYLAMCVACIYGNMLWGRFDAWRSVRLRDRYRRKYLPHAEDELYLRKEYNDVAALESFLSPFYLEKVVSIRADVLLELLEQLEEKERSESSKQTDGQPDI